MLCHDVGKFVLVIGTITNMVINKNICICFMKNGCETLCVSSVRLNEIAVQIIVSGIATKAINFRTILIGS
ncbi:hypothetical protein D3C87_1869580 [compost metagenome]